MLKKAGIIYSTLLDVLGNFILKIALKKIKKSKIARFQNEIR